LISKDKAMKDKFLKTRVPSALYQHLMARSGAEGKRLGTYVREVLENESSALTTREVLARIESSIERASSTTAVPASQPNIDAELRADLRHVFLLVRELAMHSNAQIVTRVAAQMANQAATKKGG
jgi:hypothetical protein